MRVFGSGSRGGPPAGDGDAGGAGARSSSVTGSIVKQARTKSGLGCLVAFFALFGAAGLLVVVPFFGVPALKVLRARSWNPTACTILESEVEAHSGDDTTYSVKVRYQYEVDGRTYEGHRYKFMGGSSSGQSGKQKIVDELSPGTHVACWVDPADPASSVINRGFTPDFFVILIPLVFVAVGVGGVFFAVRSMIRSRRPSARVVPGAVLSAVPPTAHETRLFGGSAAPSYGASGGGSFTTLDGPRGAVLKPSTGPLGRFIGVLLISAFWNGITGTFLYHVVKGWQSGSGDGCATAFLVPFVLIGLLLLWSVPYQFLALFNPRPTLTLDGPGLPLGTASRLAWSFSGWPSRIGRLKLTLEGREEATYRRGTSSTTDRSTFARLELLDTTDAATIARGETFVTLPDDLMCSFEATHNKVVWHLKMAGDIRFWPDVAEEIPITVTPAETSRWAT